MFSTIALIAAAAIAPAQATAAQPTGAFDPLTATYSTKTGDYCVRSGWLTATWQTGMPIRRGQCHTATAWRKRGLEFDSAKHARRDPARGVGIAAR